MSNETSNNWIDKLVNEWRDFCLANNHQRAAEGEIPLAQCSILADMAANRLRQMLCNAEETRLEIALNVMREHAATSNKAK